MPYSNPDEQRAYQNEWMQRRRREWIASRGGKCELCGSTDELQVDHFFAAHKSTHRVWSWAEKRRNEELAKCWVLCKTCHDRKTAALDRAQLLRHPSVTSYRNHGCRCEECARLYKEDNKKCAARARARRGSNTQPLPPEGSALSN